MCIRNFYLVGDVDTQGQRCCISKDGGWEWIDTVLLDGLEIVRPGDRVEIETKFAIRVVPADEVREICMALDTVRNDRELQPA